MKNSICILGLVVGLYAYNLQAQTFDINKAVADPFTFIFNDGSTTVQGFIYSTLEKKTSCCGNDAVYLEIKIEPNGTTSAVKALTGKNECYKKAIVDIVKLIKWNNANIKTSKSVYLEVKPVLACTNSPNDNKYTGLNINPQNNNQATNNTNKDTKSNSTTTATTKDSTNKLGYYEPLPKPKYISAGNRNPDSTHVKSKMDAPGPMASLPSYKDGETAMAIYFKSSLRKAGVCGLAHVLAEISLSKDGSVKSYRIFNANSDQVFNAAGPVIMGLKYNSLPMDQITYFEFKADIDCTEQAPKLDLTQIPNFLKTE